MTRATVLLAAWILISTTTTRSTSFTNSTTTMMIVKVMAAGSMLSRSLHREVRQNFISAPIEGRSATASLTKFAALTKEANPSSTRDLYHKTLSSVDFPLSVIRKQRSEIKDAIQAST